MIYLIGWLIFINILLFSLMKIDKSKAKKRKQRIAERTLLFLGIFGGALGGLLGMQTFRHKTKHRYFYVIYILAAIGWLVGTIYTTKLFSI